MSDLISGNDVENQIAADRAAQYLKATAKIEPGKLFAVRTSATNRRAQAYIKRLGGQFEAKSKLWVIRANAGSMDNYALLFTEGFGATVLSGAEYAAAYQAARA